MTSNDQERENALNWVLKHKVNGVPFMKHCKGDVSLAMTITPIVLAGWCADYHKAMTQYNLHQPAGSLDMSKSRKRNSNLLPIPEGVTVGGPVLYYSRGWRYGKLEEIKGNDAGIHLPAAYGETEGSKVARLKWVRISDIKRVDE